MSDPHALTPQPAPQQQEAALRTSLDEARRALREADAQLAEEQAAVNRFRMQCRLKIGDQLDRALALTTEREALLTELALLRQDEALDEILGDAAEEDLLADLPAEDAALLQSLPRASSRDLAAEKRLFRQLARRFHPDLAAQGVERAYATAIMSAVNTAYAAGDLGTLRDLAGELAPEEVAELARIDARALRKLREQVLQCQRRRRHALLRLQQLRQENAARLWRRAQVLEADGVAWWEEVREELAAVTERLTTDIEQLRRSLAHRAQLRQATDPDTDAS